MMDVTVPLVLLFLVLPTLTLASAREFRFINLQKNWTEAQSYCREKYGDLVTIQNADDWTRVNQMLVNSGETDAWIGLYDDLTSWRWTIDDSALCDEELESWFIFVAKNYRSNEHCGAFYGGELNDYDCVPERRSVCYNETTNSFIRVNLEMSWQSALTYCRQTHTDLAKVRNQQDWNDIISIITASSQYWVGLSRDNWKWSDNSDASFRQWGDAEPDGGLAACASANAAGFFDWKCEDNLPFICSVAPKRKKVLKVTVKTTGSVNLNDPLVQEAILKQMEKDLREHGVHPEFRLSWRTQPHGDIFNKTEL